VLCLCRQTHKKNSISLKGKPFCSVYKGKMEQDRVLRVYRDFHPRMHCLVSEDGVPEMKGLKKMARQCAYRYFVISLHFSHISSLTCYYFSNSSPRLLSRTV